MKILVWNIQRINLEKVTNFSLEIGELVHREVGKEPYVLCVLENKMDGDLVTDTMMEGIESATGSGLHTDAQHKHVIPMGGSNTLKENVIIIAGNGASFENVVSWTEWQVEFNNRCKELQGIRAEKAEQKYDAMNQSGRPIRASIQAGRERALADGRAYAFRDASALRNPVSLTIRHGIRRVRALVIHAPGPGDGVWGEEKTAVIYANAVCRSTKKHDIIIGDFNLRISPKRIGFFCDQSTHTGHTVKKVVPDDCDVPSSRLDRVYAKPGFKVGASKALDTAPGKELTDHYCLVVKIPPLKSLKGKKASSSGQASSSNAMDIDPKAS